VSEQPLVWVVTPVHDGETYLAECIESVLAQTYDNWSYLVVDNRSTDGTADIVREYARRDPRISLHQNTAFLPIIANWNHALRQLPPAARYCKVVHADDTLLPRCLERMVALAEQNASVSIVTSYAIWGRDVRHDGFVAYPEEVVDGREVCRAALLGQGYVFGSPSSLLLRADEVRRRPSFYNEQNFHADTEVCFDLLRTTDLGFVHEILTRTRVHEEAMTSFAARLDTFQSCWLTILYNYGRYYLDRRAYRRRWARAVRRYVVFLAKAAVRGKFRDRAFRQHHRETGAFVARAIAGNRGWSTWAPRRIEPPPLAHRDEREPTSDPR
jgi:glycosyltransferase involved in cell wall biosynthesis